MPSMADLRLAGIGMTSARTRDRLVQRLREQGISNLAVLERIRNVPRHIFVDEALGSRAYEDTALPIGFGQTISQPFIVARMTESLLEGGSVSNVLEVGTGCGYQTAVLAPLVTHLNTIEPLLARARERLKELGIATCVSGTVMVRSAGRRTRPSTASWSRLRLSRFR